MWLRFVCFRSEISVKTQFISHVNIELAYFGRIQTFTFLLHLCNVLIFFICHRKPSDIPAGNVQPFIAKIQQPQSEGQEPQDMIGWCF